MPIPEGRQLLPFYVNFRLVAFTDLPLETRIFFHRRAARTGQATAHTTTRTPAQPPIRAGGARRGVAAPAAARGNCARVPRCGGRGLGVDSFTLLQCFTGEQPLLPFYTGFCSRLHFYRLLPYPHPMGTGRVRCIFLFEV
jgi:hypothetical protein